ncbi:MAG: leucine-rich repeat protein, partial [Alistipes sp.]|nr:leucine-rich repeat protein [Alistipes sp.]
TRPFAKLRVITTDMKELGYLGIEPNNAVVTYTTQFHESFNALNGEYGAETVSKTHNGFIIKEYDDNEANKSKVLFTDYFFADDSDVVKFVMNVNEANGALIKSNAFTTDIPVKRNNLTTIAGNILTDGNNIKVEVKPEFGGETQWPDANNNAEQLAYAAMFGGEVTLSEDVVLTQPLTIVEGANAVINLGGKKLTGAIVLAEGAELTVNNGVIENTDRTVSGITSNGDLTLNNVTIESARHGVRVESGKVVINGGEYKVAPISNSTLHALNIGDDGTTAEVVIKGGTFIGPKGTMADSGSAVNVRNGSSVVIEGGNFSGGKSKTLAGQNITVKGGTFDQNPANYVAAGYKAIAADGIYYVLSETIANAAEAEGVTTVTESTADVATALATNNGEATLFIWNDVAYIAKYGEVVITSDADEATTVRSVVEYSTGLTNATVADGIEVVGNRTFRKCANLETVALPNTLTEIGPAVFQSCSKLANITIPESVTTIGEGAFAECTSLTSINIPAGVTRLEKDVLRNTGLVSVEFHEGVTYFGAQAFRDCKQLKEVIINAPEFTVEANAFGVMSGTLPGTTIYVANDEMKAYLESTLAYKNQFKIVAPAEDKNELKTELLEAIKNGETNIVIDAMGSNIGDLNYGLTTTMVPEGTTVTIRNAAIEGKSYGNGVNGTIIFEGCTFNNSGAYSIHFDNGNGNVIFKNCDLYGWNSFGASLTSVSFEDCTLTGNGSYALIRSYADLTLTNCVINTSNANHNDGYSEGVEAIAPATLTENNVTYVIESDNALANALAEGKDVTLSQDVTTEAATTAPYGNKYAFKQDGGVIDGNGHELYMECYGDDYGIMTSGGTIKNLTITEGCRAVMIMYPQQDVILDNVKIGGDGVLYPINTGEAGADDVDLIVTNSELAGWTSYGLIKSATFTNVEFKQGTYYNNIYGRVLKPYVNTTLTNCTFVEHMNLDLSSLNKGHKIVMKNCKVNGVAVTAEVFTIPTTDAQYDTELFTIDLPSWASSINDCVVFE